MANISLCCVRLLIVHKQFNIPVVELIIALFKIIFFYPFLIKVTFTNVLVTIKGLNRMLKTYANQNTFKTLQIVSLNFNQ